MAWIKLDDELERKPQFQRLCDRLCERAGKAADDAADYVLARLARLWRWANAQAVEGVLAGCGLQACVRVAGGDLAFWQAVVDVGWLDVRPEGIALPRFERWFGGRAGERSSGRSSAAERQRRYRERKRAEAERSTSTVTRDVTPGATSPVTRGAEGESEREPDIRSVLTAGELTEADHECAGDPDQETPLGASREAQDVAPRPGAAREASTSTPRLQSDDPKAEALRVARDVTRVTPAVTRPHVTLPTTLETWRLEQVAGELFRRLRYHGDDGRLVWQAAALQLVGLASAHQVADAAEGVAQASSSIGNPVAYFRQCLAEHVGGPEVLAAAIRRVDALVPSHLKSSTTRAATTRQPTGPQLHGSRDSPARPRQPWAAAETPATLQQILDDVQKGKRSG